MSEQDISSLINSVINLLPFLFILIGFYIGSRREKQHYKKIIKREKELSYMPVTSFSYDIENTTGTLVYGSVVVSNDAFKNFAAGLRNIFGGRVKSYENLVDRGRRESILRMQTEAKKLGASAVCNLRLTTTILGGSNDRGSNGVEVLAYGTALIDKTIWEKLKQSKSQ